MAAKIFLILSIAIVITQVLCIPGKTSEKVSSGIDNISDKIGDISSSAKKSAKKGITTAKKEIGQKTNSIKKSIKTKKDEYADLPDVEQLPNMSNLPDDYLINDADINDDFINKHYPAIRSLFDDLFGSDQVECEHDYSDKKSKKKKRSLLEEFLNEEPQDKPEPKGKRSINETNEQQEHVGSELEKEKSTNNKDVSHESKDGTKTEKRSVVDDHSKPEDKSKQDKHNFLEFLKF